MKNSLILTCLIFTFGWATAAHADTFGSGANVFDIDFVTIGNPGNADDVTGDPNPAGKVDSTYRIGQFEISRDMITKAYREGGLGITMISMGFVTGGTRDDMPATGVSWFEAAQFVNWLNLDNGSTEAYKFNGGSFELWQPGDAGYNPDNVYRNSGAKYFLPSADEWYKAAFYNPAGAGSYGDYPTANGLVPSAVASGTAANTAVYASFATGPADITQAGGLSPYGTMGQGGNVWEWEETDFDLVNAPSGSVRGVRGGSWSGNSSLSSSVRFFVNPSIGGSDVGFRVASIPEPSSLLLLVGLAGSLLLKRQR